MRAGRSPAERSRLPPRRAGPARAAAGARGRRHAGINGDLIPHAADKDCVHKPVDDLGKRAASLCKSGEKLGICRRAAFMTRLTPAGNTINSLGKERKLKLSTRRAAMADK